MGYVDAYSAFMDNAKVHQTPLHSTLQEYDIDTLYIVGIATDFCVSWTAQDGIDLGYSVSVILDATAPIAIPIADNMTTVDLALAEFAAKGVSVISAEEVLGLGCPAVDPACPFLNGISLLPLGYIKSSSPVALLLCKIEAALLSVGSFSA